MPSLQKQKKCVLHTMKPVKDEGYFASHGRLARIIFDLAIKEQDQE